MDAAGVQSDLVVARISNGDRGGIVVEQDLMTRLRYDRLNFRRRIGRLLTRAPVTAGPDRVRNIAAFEFDPDAGADFRQESEADIGTGVRYAGHAPTGGLFTQHRRNLRLN